jgi:hypothetical protein
MHRRLRLRVLRRSGHGWRRQKILPFLVEGVASPTPDLHVVSRCDPSHTSRTMLVGRVVPSRVVSIPTSTALQWRDVPMMGPWSRGGRAARVAPCGFDP